MPRLLSNDIEDWGDTLFVADLHLTERIWNDRPEIAGDCQFMLDEITRTCIQNDCCLLIGGDLTDTLNPSQHVVRMLQEWLEYMNKSGIPVAFIGGNHDDIRRADGHWAITNDAMRRVVMHAPARDNLRIHGNKIHAIDFLPRREFQEVLKNVSVDAKILLCHERFKVDTFPFPGFHAEIGDIPANIKLVLVGDIHIPTYEEYQNGKQLFYPGCPYLRRINDGDNHGGVLITKAATNSSVYNTELGIYLRFTSLCSRPVLRYEVREEAHINAVVDEARKTYTGSSLPDEIRKPIVLVRYWPEGLPNGISRIEAQLLGTAHVFPLPQESNVIVNDTVINDGDDVDLSTFLSQEMDVVQYPVAHAAVLELLRGTNVDTVVETIAATRGLTKQEAKELLK